MGLYHNIPCSQCRDCQYFRLVDGYYDTPHCCDKKFDPTEDVYKYKVRDPNTTDANWYIDTDGTYPGKCRNFKKIVSNSNSERQERKVNNTPTELTKGDKFIIKLISFLVSGCGYVFFVWALIGSLTGNSFSEKWIWITGTLVISITIGILKVKTKRLGMILYIVGFLLIVAGIIVLKVLSNA